MAPPHLVLATSFINPTGLIIWLIIGLVVSFIASRVIGVGGYGIVGDITVGLVGAFIGGLLTALLIPDVNFGLIGSIIVAIIGSCILIAILHAIRPSMKEGSTALAQETVLLSEEHVKPTPAPAQLVSVPSPPQHPPLPSVKPPFFVFISHSSRDDAFGQMLARDLRKELGSDEAVWYDSDGGLYGGASWWRQIITMVSMCDVFIIIISPDSMSSRWVERELDIALNEDKIIVPLLYRQAQIRADLKTIQYISFLDGSTAYKARFNQLIQAIRH